jgi:alcohol dehydrogenase class IV
MWTQTATWSVCSERGLPVSDAFPLQETTPVALWDVDDLPDRISSLGERRVALVDTALLSLGVVDDLLAAIGPTEVVQLPPGEPRLDRIVDVVETVISQADAVVGIGGGSSLDTAKIAAAAATSDRPLADHLMAAAPFSQPLPLLAIPTTAGSGAEVTKMAVVSDGDRKSWVYGDEVRPAAAVLDPALTVSLPTPITVASGCDAFIHAIESASARSIHEASAAAGIWAAGEIVTALPEVLDEPGSMDARRRMQLAACAAGVGIDRCGVGIGHAIGHAVASLLTAPHGLLVMLGTLVAIEWAIDEAGERYEAVAKSIDAQASSAELPDLVRNLATSVGYEKHLAPYAAASPLGGAALAEELPRREHKPMWANSAAVPTPADLTWLAHATADEWARIAAG